MKQTTKDAIMVSSIITLLTLAVFLILSLYSEDNVGQELHVGIVEKAQFVPDEQFTPGVQHDMYYIWLNGKRYSVTRKNYDNIEIGDKVYYHEHNADKTLIKVIVIEKTDQNEDDQGELNEPD